MAWIESHQELGRHPKTRRLARTLGESLPSVVGRLQFLWWWALDYAEDGDLSGYSDEDIADAVLWDGDAAQFVAALTEAGFLEEDRRIHDWWEYAQRWIEKRRANAERMRRARAGSVQPTSTERAAHVQRTTSARAGATGPNLTKPNQTRPEPETGDDARAAAAVAPPKPVPKRTGRNLAPLIDAMHEAGLDPPQFGGAEAKAANELLGRWTPEQLAQCWQDHASGEYGDDFSRRDLSFGYLSARNRVGNWAAWRQRGKSAAPVVLNGTAGGKPKAGANINGRGYRSVEPTRYCGCGQAYSSQLPACPACKKPAPVAVGAGP